MEIRKTQYHIILRESLERKTFLISFMLMGTTVLKEQILILKMSFLM
jgi:hypothetical protein